MSTIDWTDESTLLEYIPRLPKWPKQMFVLFSLYKYNIYERSCAWRTCIKLSFFVDQTFLCIRESFVRLRQTPWDVFCYSIIISWIRRIKMQLILIFQGYVNSIWSHDMIRLIYNDIANSVITFVSTFWRSNNNMISPSPPPHPRPTLHNIWHNWIHELR